MYPTQRPVPSVARGIHVYLSDHKSGLAKDQTNDLMPIGGLWEYLLRSRGITGKNVIGPVSLAQPFVDV